MRFISGLITISNGRHSGRRFANSLLYRTTSPKKAKVFPEPVGSKEMTSRPVNKETSETRCSNNTCINTHISSEQMWNRKTKYMCHLGLTPEPGKSVRLHLMRSRTLRTVYHSQASTNWYILSRLSSLNATTHKRKIKFWLFLMCSRFFTY
jgi:hypothetical protein